MYCQRLAALPFGKVAPLLGGVAKGVPGNPRQQGIPEVGTRKSFIYAGLRVYASETPYPRRFQRRLQGGRSAIARQRFLCVERIHLTFATALLRLTVLLVLPAACRLVSKINAIRYTTSGRFFTRRCGSYPAAGCLLQPTPTECRPGRADASRPGEWRRMSWSCRRRPSPPSCRNAPSA